MTGVSEQDKAPLSSLASKKKKRNATKRARSLSHGRPQHLLARCSFSYSSPLARHSRTIASHPSSRTTRSVIRKHHQLSKAHSQAVRAGDASLARAFEAQISENGGLEEYQAASIAGQSAARGGDTSKKLLVFLDRFQPQIQEHLKRQARSIEPTQDARLQRNGRDRLSSKEGRKYRVLDVGALSTSTALSRHCNGLFNVTRIDLHSQEVGITQQDFMQRPLPATDAEKFHLVCLSLVLNYVPDPRGRGEMLKRVSQFLLPLPGPACQRSEEPSKAHSESLAEGGGLTAKGRRLGVAAGCKNKKKNQKEENDTEEDDQEEEAEEQWPFPGLFLVLPAPCITNSRYLTLARLTNMLSSLGYALVEEQTSSKLVYTLWKWQGHSRAMPQHADGLGEQKNLVRGQFRKVEVNPGKQRNNFAIILE